jgi:Tol biopolymer transport system component
MTRRLFQVALGLLILAPGLVFHAPVRSADPDRLLFTSTREGRARLYLLRPDTGDVQPLPNVADRESLTAWSPDGKKIAFCSRKSGNGDIYVMDADGTNVRQLTTDPAEDLVSSWSPDGKKLAFTSRRNGDGEIYVMNADGSEQRNLTRNPAYDGDPAWSPDGKQILFVSNRSGAGLRLYVMDPEGENVRQLPAKESRAGPVFPAWSPDGKKIAYADGTAEGVELFTCDADGTNPKQLTRMGGINTFPAWSPDGKRIAFQHWDKAEEPGSLWIVNVADGVQSHLGHTGPFQLGRPAWKPR